MAENNSLVQNSVSTDGKMGSGQIVMPYDENLLERARTQWQFGDWESLARIDRDTLQHHPDRAKLALLAAAGRLQTGNDVEAKRFIRLSQDWGASKKLISQILITGVHNSLARAAAIGNQPQRALQHFENAICIGTPGINAKFFTKARMGEQLSQLGLPNPEGHLKDGTGETSPMPDKLPPLLKRIETITETLNQQKAELDAQLKKHLDELIQVRKFIDSSLKKEITNATKQVEISIGLQSYFATGELPDINTEQHSWPVSRDFALYLIELVELNDYDLIIEFGSGISTVIVAKTIAKMAPKRNRAGKPPVDFISYDHLEQYYQQTRRRLEQAGLANSVQLTLAPLQDWHAQNGTTYHYYNCQPTLTALKQKYSLREYRLLVVIDGPPGKTCKHARYPAVPIIDQYLSAFNADFLIDDYKREEEQEIVKLWQKFYSEKNVSFIPKEVKLQKGAFLISVFS